MPPARTYTPKTYAMLGATIAESNRMRELGSHWAPSKELNKIMQDWEHEQYHDQGRNPPQAKLLHKKPQQTKTRRKLTSQQRKERDQMIFEDLQTMNVREVAAKHDLTSQMIYYLQNKQKNKT